MNQGKSVAYAIFNLQKSGKFFVGHGEDIYEGIENFYEVFKKLFNGEKKGKLILKI